MKNKIRNLSALLIFILVFFGTAQADSWSPDPQEISQRETGIKASKLVSLPDGNKMNIWMTGYNTPDGYFLGTKVSVFERGTWGPPTILGSSLPILNGDDGYLITSSDGNGRVAIAWEYSTNPYCETLNYIEYNNGQWS